jgi:hypothetical protein
MHIFNAPIDRKMLCLTVVLAGTWVLPGCTTDGNPVRDTAAAVGLGPTIAPAPEFVERSRPAKLDYIPVGTAGSGRPTPARTTDEVKAAEAELEAIRASNEAAAQAAREVGAAAAVPVPVQPKPARSR